MPRLGYLKSRHGCDRCKQRRVKCDECTPCSACIRHGIRCSLLDKPPRTQSKAIKEHRAARMESFGSPIVDQGIGSARGSPRRLIPAHPNSNAVSPPIRAKGSITHEESLPRILPTGELSTSEEDRGTPLPAPAFIADPYPYLLPLLSQPESPGIPAWVSDLELMHHFTATAWKTLPRSDEIQRIWQIEIPKLALEYEFLMHQLLCVSASHLVSLGHDKAKKFASLASHHQNNAIKGLRGVLGSIDESNCHAVFLSASLLTISAFAASCDHHEPKPQPGIGHLLEIFYLMRGMSEILNSHEKTILKSPIGFILQLSEYRSGTPFLMTILEGVSSAMLSRSEGGIMQSLPCQHAATALIFWISRAAQDAPIPEQRLVNTWPIAVNNEFMELIREHHHGALVLLGFYCQILRHVEPDCWYLSGWADSVKQDIDRHIKS
ncbi:hypothetical protein F4809DRAFT_51302 [Biscogniauxia mediterranea]|nr:hypothetical protein F4809DRAFT_51302 [Biscogniauxia mediterranea]